MLVARHDDDDDDDEISTMHFNTFFLSFCVFGLLSSSSLLLYSSRFGRYILRPSSGVSYRIL